MLDIVRKEIDGSHYYFVNGEFYPSVTRILDEAGPVPYQLKKWFKENSVSEIDSKSEVALAFGSKMHDAYEKLLNGLELDLLNHYPMSKEKKHIASFVQWFNDNKPKVLETELTVASESKKYAGTLDLLCEIDGQKWIIDFKTSASIYWSYELQIAAYKNALEEMDIAKDVRTGILRTGTKHKSGYEFKESESPFSAFHNIYNTYLNQNGGKVPPPPMIDVYPDTIKLEL